MSDSSIASSISAGLQSVLGRFGSSLKSRVSEMLPRRKASDEPTGESPPEKIRAAQEEKPDSSLLSDARREIIAYARANQPLFDRAERFGERAERLSEDGSTSESARNKAQRARQEILAGLSSLRDSFVNRNPDSPEEARIAFDRESEAVIPA